eukprot:Sdes_comp23959_c0_seq1m22061
MSVISIEDTAHFSSLLAEHKYVMADFYATWCGPCRLIAPHIASLAASHTDVCFVKIDVDNCEELASTYEVSAMPTFIFFVGGQKSEVLVGANKDALTNLVLTNKKK